MAAETQQSLAGSNTERRYVQQGYVDEFGSVVTAGYNLKAVAVKAPWYLLDPALTELRRFAVSGSHGQTTGNIRTALICTSRT